MLLIEVIEVSSKHVLFKKKSGGRYYVAERTRKHRKGIKKYSDTSFCICILFRPVKVKPQGRKGKKSIRNKSGRVGKNRHNSTPNKNSLLVKKKKSTLYHEIVKMLN